MHKNDYLVENDVTSPNVQNARFPIKIKFLTRLCRDYDRVVLSPRHIESSVMPAVDLTLLLSFIHEEINRFRTISQPHRLESIVIPPSSKTPVGELRRGSRSHHVHLALI